MTDKTKVSYKIDDATGLLVFDVIIYDVAPLKELIEHVASAELAAVQLYDCFGFLEDMDWGPYTFYAVNFYDNQASISGMKSELTAALRDVLENTGRNILTLTVPVRVSDDVEALTVDLRLSICDIQDLDGVDHLAFSNLMMAHARGLTLPYLSGLVSMVKPFELRALQYIGAEVTVHAVNAGLYHSPEFVITANEPRGGAVRPSRVTFKLT